MYALAQAGWYGGNPTLIYNSPIDDVLMAYQYEIMVKQYKMTDYLMTMENK